MKVFVKIKYIHVYKVIIIYTKFLQYIYIYNIYIYNLEN